MGSTYELRQIAKNDPDPGVRIAAIYKLNSKNDEYELRQIAKSDTNASVRIAAVQKLEKDD
ncbi:MAG: HEAT repeat domain-containing protein [Deltaproteobacteria bacterium]|nr:HEAT repeat domain-containing protein [Deltaproteobacteria bacterium]